MLIKRKVNKVEEVIPDPEFDKKDKEYKRMRNVGLASLGTGAVMGLANIISKGKNLRDKVSKADKRVTGVGSIALLGTGAGLTGYSEIKRRNLKKKKEREEKKDDNTKE